MKETSKKHEIMAKFFFCYWNKSYHAISWFRPLECSAGAWQTRAPRAERGPGASSNITVFRLCELQNRRRKCSFKKVFTEILKVFPVEIRWSPKKKVFTEILTVFLAKLGELQKKGLPVEIKCSPKKKGFQASHDDFIVSFEWALLKPMGPEVIVPRCPPLGGLIGKTTVSNNENAFY